MILIQRMASKTVVWLLFSCYVVSDFLWPHNLQHISFLVHHCLPEFAQTHVHWMCWWCYPTISSSVTPFSSCPQSFPASGSSTIRYFSISEDQSIKSFSFSISPSNEYSGLISFRIIWFDLVVQGTLKGLLQHHSSNRLVFNTCFAFLLFDFFVL